MNGKCGSNFQVARRLKEKKSSFPSVSVGHIRQLQVVSSLHAMCFFTICERYPQASIAQIRGSHMHYVFGRINSAIQFMMIMLITWHFMSVAYSFGESIRIILSALQHECHIHDSVSFPNLKPSHVALN